MLPNLLGLPFPAHGITGRNPVTFSRRPARSPQRNLSLRQFVQILNEGHRGTVDALNLRISRFNDIIFVWRMRAAPMTKTEMPGGFVQWRAGKDITRPRPGAAR